MGGWKIGEQTYGTLFVRSPIEDCINGVVSLLEKVADVLDSQIADGFSLLVAGASGHPFNYIYREGELPADWVVLKEAAALDDKWFLHPVRETETEECGQKCIQEQTVRDCA